MAASGFQAEVRRYGPEDEDAVRSLRQEAFRLPLFTDLWMDEGWVLTEGGKIQAALLSPSLGHFFGGRSVGTRGITGVVVAPQARGLKRGEALMRAVLTDMRDQGTPLSTLTPSTLPFYRRLGYAIAGSINCVRVPCSDLRGRASLDVAPLDLDAEADQLRSCYREFATRSTGLIERDETWWLRRTLRPSAADVLYSYGVWEDGRLVGYCLYTQAPEPAFGRSFLRARGYHYSLACRDLVWLTPEAGQALLAFASGNRPLGADLVWHAPLQDPLQLMCGSLNWQLQWSFPWMARVVDVKSALEARGFPQHVNAAVVLAVSDPLLSDAASVLEISLEAGVCSTKQVNQSTVTMSTSAFSALYTGYLTAHQLAYAGHVEGATRKELTALDEIFQLPTPWAMEVF